MIYALVVRLLWIMWSSIPGSVGSLVLCYNYRALFKGQFHLAVIIMILSTCLSICAGMYSLYILRKSK